jgi:nucleotide-binding universal stress UspA family protein
MNKILIAVDDTKTSREIFSKCTQICKRMAPEEILLLYVEKFEGRSFLDEMLGEAELATLKEVLEGSEYQAALDEKANKVLNYYKGVLNDGAPVSNVRTIIKSGHPAEEILKTSQEEDVGMIIMGSKRGRMGASQWLMVGSISRKVVNVSDRPVLIVK